MSSLLSICILICLYYKAGEKAGTRFKYFRSITKTKVDYFKAEGPRQLMPLENLSSCGVSAVPPTGETRDGSKEGTI